MPLIFSNLNLHDINVDIFGFICEDDGSDAVNNDIPLSSDHIEYSGNIKKRISIFPLPLQKQMPEGLRTSAYLLSRPLYSDVPRILSDLDYTIRGVD